MTLLLGALNTQTEKAMTQVHTIHQPRIEQEATWIELDQAALLHNLSEINRSTLPGAEILAVIKANAYGHGLVEIARSLEGKAVYFGVVTLEEALRLRRIEIETPILLFGILFPKAAEAAIDARISLSVSSLEQANEISELAVKLNKPAVIHVKVDTGMGRLGISKGEAVRTIKQIHSLPMLELEGIFTHFPQGEAEQDPFTQEQIRIFNRIVSELSRQRIHFAYRHAANTTAIALHRESHFNLVRPGLGLYGIYPFENIRKKLNLQHVLSWRARVILVKQLTQGESAGYGRTFKVLGTSTHLAVLPVGYSSGYPFALSNRGFVLIHGKRYPVAGRVSMDYMTVDLGFEPDVRAGDIATLLGSDGAETISAEFLADRAGTIPYEIVTQIHPSISRFLV